jgi:hypothetical protein
VCLAAHLISCTPTLQLSKHKYQQVITHDVTSTSTTTHSLTTRALAAMIIPRMVSTVLRIGTCLHTHHIPPIHLSHSPIHLRRHCPRHRMPHPRPRHQNLQQRHSPLDLTPHRPRAHLDPPYHRIHCPLGHRLLLSDRMAARVCRAAHAPARRCGVR